jgi:hypothetical protein
MDALGTEPRPARSRRLRLPEPSPAPGWEVRRIRVEDWRIVYAVSDERRQVAALAVRRRPPYDYDDLEALLTDL